MQIRLRHTPAYNTSLESWLNFPSSYLFYHERVLDHAFGNSWNLGEVAFPEHALKIFKLFLLESLITKLERTIVEPWIISEAKERDDYLDVNMPCVLSRLLEICENTFHALSYHARIGCCFPSQCS